MKIMVCIKQIPHQDARLEISTDGTWIKEEALQAKDAGECEVVAVSIGPDRVTQALRTALGMGADRAIHVKDAEADGSDSLGIAKILAAIAKEENPDLIYTGLMADDGNFAAVPMMLAELLGMPHTSAAQKLDHANGSVTVEREIEGGAREVVELQKPCLIAVQTGLNQVRYASLKGIMAAKKKPLDVKTIADLGLSGQVGAANAKISVEKISMPVKGSTAEMVTGSAGDMASSLVSKIKELGLL
jgi:electron transfer flavoprotein beta subunit